MTVSSTASTYYPREIVRNPLDSTTRRLVRGSFYGPRARPDQREQEIRETVLRKVENIRLLRERLRELPGRAAALGMYDEVPNEVAIGRASLVLDALVGFTLNPDRVVASAEGGVSVVFFSGPRRASVECLNSGEITAAIVAEDGQVTAWEVTRRSIYAAVDQICGQLEQPAR